MDLTLKSISVSLSNKVILDSIDLEVKKGAFIALLGPSGCGKSTLLKTVAGLLTPMNGDILINREIVNDQPSNKRGAVIVFQDLRLFPNMTVEDNIAFPLKMQGISQTDRYQTARKLLQRVQLEGYEKRKIDQMSGGQLQRVALARALAANPKILLLDEPFSSLDDGLRQDMRRLVLDLHQEYGITTILVTHDQQEALMMSDRIAVMMEGRIIQYDTPRKIYNQPVHKMVADYFGGGNYIEGEVKGGLFQSELIRFPTQETDGRYLALFRPSALNILPQEGSYQVISIKYLGDKWEIILQGSTRQFVVIAPADHDWNIGDNVQIDFNLSKAILIKL